METIIEPEFKEKLLIGLWDDLKFSCILIVLRIIKDRGILNNLEKDGVAFKVRDGLLYYVVRPHFRLYILNAIVLEVLSLVYNCFYFRIKHLYYKLVQFYIPRLKKRLDDYITHYPICQYNKTL
jgi:hypothetical protein